PMSCWGLRLSHVQVQVTRLGGQASDRLHRLPVTLPSPGPDVTRLFAPFRMSSIRAGMCPSLVACSSLGLVTEMGRLSYTSPSTLLLTPFLDVSADLKENVAQQVKNLLASQVVQDDWK